MAIIPSDEKVFMVNKTTNTTFGGSKSTKAMQQWYIMQDIIDSIPAPTPETPTLQEAATAGSSITDTPVTINYLTADPFDPPAIKINAYSEAQAIVVESNQTAVQVTSAQGYGISATSGDNSAVNAYCTGSSPAVLGTSQQGAGGYFYSVFGPYALICQGEAAKPGGGSWAALSDSRVKENINPYTKGLLEILSINPVTYDYNGLGGIKKSTGYVGVIAQEIKEVLPETVSTNLVKLNEEDEDKTELLTFNSTALTYALINAVKELKAEIDLLKNNQ